MKPSFRWLQATALLLALLPLPGRAEVGFAPIFSDGAVLQCEMKCNLWGQADPGARVEVTVDGAAAATAIADAAGSWRTVLDPHPPGGPHVIEAVSGDQSAKLDDVWFGEVWIASGQSNMAMPLEKTDGGPAALARTEPGIRFVIVPRRTAPAGRWRPVAGDLQWSSFGPATSGRFSAVAFHFADRLRTETGRKIGIIQSAVGATPAQAWTPLAALEAEPELRHYSLEEKIEASSPPGEEPAMESDGQESSSGNGPATARATAPNRRAQQEAAKQPAVLFENMIRPVIPYTARGVIWYQGEANVPVAQEYRTLFPTMIAAWRSAWAIPDWPFLFVQLAAFNGRGNQDWPDLRAAQTATRDSFPHTGMAVAIDCGAKNNIHPPDKKTVGDRLALLALDQVYQRDVLSRGPVAANCIGSMEGKLRVRFDHAAGGLQTSDGSSAVPAFEVSGADGMFHEARATIVAPDTVEISCDTVKEPVAVRYAWSNWVEPPVTLQNSAGLPAEPFVLRTSADRYSSPTDARDVPE